MRRRFRSVAKVALVTALVALTAPAVGEEPAGPGAAGPTVCLQPMGRYDAALLDAGRAGVEYLYGFETRVLEPVAMPTEAWYAPRKRYRADTILDWLEANVVTDSGCAVVVGFTQHDISVTKGELEDWGIFGLGSLGGHEAVVSTKRLGKKSRRSADKAVRTIKVVNHEIGHVLGIPHVEGEGCLMNDAEGTIATVDAETGLLCPSSVDWIEAHFDVALPRHDAFDWDAVLGGS